MTPTYTDLWRVTPAIARAYLRRASDRYIEFRRVLAYADKMHRNEWRDPSLTDAPIAFDHDWNIVSGHHRLLAVTLAGAEITFKRTLPVTLPDTKGTHANRRK
jgi:hypothetical protein